MRMSSAALSVLLVTQLVKHYCIVTTLEITINYIMTITVINSQGPSEYYISTLSSIKWLTRMSFPMAHDVII